MTNSDLPRVTQKIFGENAGQNIGQFGSALTGAPNRTGDISQIQALDAWSAGWEGAVLPTRDFPALEEMTGVQKVITQQLAYFFQKGFPEWDANTTYFATKSFAQVNGVVYQSLTNNNKGNNPTTSPTNWKIWEPNVSVGANVDLSNLSGTGENHFANPDLSNITDIAEQHIDTVTARPLSDNACTQENFPDEFDYWYNQKYTTFNNSNISTIGTPTISPYGVISDCGDYDYFLTPTIDVTAADSWELRFVYTPSSAAPTTDIGLLGSNWLNVSFTTAKKITATVSYTGGSLTLTSTGTFNNDDKIFCKISYDSTGYKLYASVNPFDYGTAATNTQTAKAASAQALKLGNVSATSYLSQGSIDMKYFELDINGQNVQNYKQTGVDRIITNNYQVVGHVPISKDGLLGTCSPGNGVILNGITLADLKDKSWVITGRSIYNGNNSTDTVFKLSGTAQNDYMGYGSIIADWINKRTLVWLRTGIEEDNQGAHIQYNFDNNAYSVEVALSFDITTGSYTLYAATNGQKLNYINTWTPTTSSPQLYYILTNDSQNITAGIGSNNAHYNKNLIDLNCFKVFINGVLKKQACLYIPYTASHDGTKIVDSAYFGRVQDCCEQTGQANYLTLDEQNQQYYLPQGTVSGMLSQTQQKIDEFALSAVPVGTSLAYEGTTPPDGWFPESGAEVRQSAYPKLYAVVGDKYNLETTQAGYFRLPDTNVSSRFYEGSTTPGTLTDAGLPNITGRFNADQLYNGGGYGDGAFRYGGAQSYPTPNSSSDSSQGGFIFNASYSSAVYGKSTTVQPKSITKLFIIKHD